MPVPVPVTLPLGLRLTGRCATGYRWSVSWECFEHCRHVGPGVPEERRSAWAGREQDGAVFSARTRFWTVCWRVRRRSRVRLSGRVWIATASRAGPYVTYFGSSGSAWCSGFPCRTLLGLGAADWRACDGHSSPCSGGNWRRTSDCSCSSRSPGTEYASSRDSSSSSSQCRCSQASTPLPLSKAGYEPSRWVSGRPSIAPPHTRAPASACATAAASAAAVSSPQPPISYLHSRSLEGSDCGCLRR